MYENCILPSQINQTLWIREAIDATAKICYCCSQSDSTNQTVRFEREYDRVTITEGEITDDEAVKALSNKRLDRRIRGDIKKNDEWNETRVSEYKTWNKYNVRYDRQARRWYLKLGAFDVKEIRAKIWQCPNDSDQ